MRMKCLKCGQSHDHREDHACKPVQVERPIVFVETKSKPARQLKADLTVPAEVKIEDAAKPKRQRNDYMRSYMIDWRKRDKERKRHKTKEKP